MQLNNWKIYDKSGSPINWTSDSYLPLTFSSDSSSAGAAGYFITDPSGIITDAEITNSGFYYTEGNTTVSYQYIFDGIETDVTGDVSINYIDVSIFNPEAVNTQGILSLSNIDVSVIDLVYPSTTYSGAIFLTPVSQGLVETEHLFIFEQFDSSLIRPYSSEILGGDLVVNGTFDSASNWTINQPSDITISG